MISFSQDSVDSIASVKLILSNANSSLLYRSNQIPKNVLTSLMELNSGDEFDVKLTNRRRIQLLNSGYFSQANLLFFKSDSGVVINYYLVESTTNFSWSVSPLLDVNQKLGIQVHMAWDRLLNGSSQYLMGGIYSDNKKGLNFIFMDRFWYPPFSYQIALRYEQSRYQFADLTESDRFETEATVSRLQLGYHLNPDQSLKLSVELNNSILKKGFYTDQLDIEYEVLRLNYNYSILDWPVYPFSGQQLEIQLSNYTHILDNWYRSIYLSYEQYYPLTSVFSAKNRILLDSYFSSVPLFMRLHLDGQQNRSQLRHLSLSGDAFAFIEQELRFNTDLDIRPEGFNSLKYTLGAKFQIGKIWNHNDTVDSINWYWSSGLNVHLFFLKNMLTISANVDRYKNFFLDMDLRIL